jgi:3-hydroxybutyryl-CoA dehydrogenase
MGSGIAQVFALGGYEVHITDNDRDTLKALNGKIQQSLEAMSQASFISVTEAKQASNRIIVVPELPTAVQDVQLVTECIVEKLASKQEMFAQLERFAPPYSVLASNTSSLSLSDIALHLEDKSRLIITHYFNPAHILPTVEVVACPATSSAVADRVCRLLVSVGKVPIVLRKEIPGFIVNRIQAAMVREALFLLEQGITTAEELDLAVRGSMGARLSVLGPCQVMDWGGLDIWAEVIRNLFPHLSDQREVPSIVDEKLCQGHLGFKSGRGFYEWSREARTEKAKLLQQQLMRILTGSSDKCPAQ